MMDAIYRELLHGRRAHVDPLACLEDVSAEVAARRVEAYPHSIWQIVGHMTYWMEYELERIAGKHPPYPEHAIESWPSHLAPANEAEWLQARLAFGNLIDRLGALSMSSPAALQSPVATMHVKEEARSYSVEAVLWQIMVHNSYHVGQIALLRKATP